jgi:hypothetical protein
MLKAAVTATVNNEAPMKLAILNNEIAQGDFELNMKVPIQRTDAEKMQCSNEWRSYRE